MTALLHLPKTKDAQVFFNVSWEQFQAIDQAFVEIPGIKFRYLDHALEIMAISEAHEELKSTIGLLLEAYLNLNDSRFYKRGGPSLGDRALNAVSELDESYSIGTRRAYADLIAEGVISSGGLDKLEGDRRMGIQEVWFWENGVLDIYHLRETGYEMRSSSHLLPNLPMLLNLPIALLCRYVTYHDQHDAVREFCPALRQDDPPTPE